MTTSDDRLHTARLRGVGDASLRSANVRRGAALPAALSVWQRRHRWSSRRVERPKHVDARSKVGSGVTTLGRRPTQAELAAAYADPLAEYDALITELRAAQERVERLGARRAALVAELARSGWSQTQLAHRLGLSQSRVQQIIQSARVNDSKKNKEDDDRVR